jgi:hypothetical protein
MNQEVYQDYEPDYKPNSLEYLNDWVFHFNAYTKNWAAIPRETYNEYWNDYKNAGVIRSKSINTLLELLHKSKGSVDAIEHIINGEGAE